MSDIKKEIREARPGLRMASPLSFWIILIMSVFNLILGVSLFFAVDAPRVSASLLIVNELFTFQFWGVVFFILGLTKIYSLYSNNWKLSRQTLIAGVSIKVAWAVALTIRTLISPGTIFLNLLWITLALVQMVTYIYFMPPGAQTNVQKEKRK